MKEVCACILVFGSGFYTLAQETALKLEAASIKFHPGPVSYSADPRPQGRRVVARASTLLDLVTSAYGVRRDQIAGAPAWAASDHYDIEAQAEGNAAPTPADARLIVRVLLTERFQLKFHRETHQEPVYLLIVAPNGPKLKAADPNARPGTRTTADDLELHLKTANATLQPLVNQMTYTAGRPVVDRTGLDGPVHLHTGLVAAHQQPACG